MPSAGFEAAIPTFEVRRTHAAAALSSKEHFWTPYMWRRILGLMRYSLPGFVFGTQLSFWCHSFTFQWLRPYNGTYRLRNEICERMCQILLITDIDIFVNCNCVDTRWQQYSTVQYSTVQYSTVQYSTVQYSTVQYSTVQCSRVQYSTVQCSAVQCSAVQYSTVQYSTIQYSTVQYSTVQ